ncbi:hypothetical protein [Microbacterium aquimaris]|uniref:Uncharacterized protein n=1 Tax=Microbacterium aquimaris TaxID=459816 RepID=A0ABU5N5B8_9MICO|nr:hypothetical protein [Microbacterium aquimaris]MDZ8161279.1 hypothetical protein [Microbacterium aquimaris]
MARALMRVRERPATRKATAVAAVGSSALRPAIEAKPIIEKCTALMVQRRAPISAPIAPGRVWLWARGKMRFVDVMMWLAVVDRVTTVTRCEAQVKGPDVQSADAMSVCAKSLPSNSSGVPRGGGDRRRRGVESNDADIRARRTTARSGACAVQEWGVSTAKGRLERNFSISPAIGSFRGRNVGGPP